MNYNYTTSTLSGVDGGWDKLHCGVNGGWDKLVKNIGWDMNFESGPGWDKMNPKNKQVIVPHLI